MSGSKTEWKDATDNKTSWRWNGWWMWNHEKHERRLAKLSEQGFHLIHTRPFFAKFHHNPSSRFVYRLDYRPDLHWRSAQREEYCGICQDAGWEYVSGGAKWYYFRRPCGEHGTMDLYTDRASLRQLYRRIRWSLGLAFAAEIVILLGETVLFRYSPRDSHWWPVLGIFILLDLLLGYGWVNVTRELRRM